MTIDRVTEDKRRYMPLLLEADEQESMIERYLDEGEMYVMSDGGAAVAVCVLVPYGGRDVEIRNPAVAAEYRGRGYERMMIGHALDVCRPRYGRVYVGTGDVPSTVGFYRACGFRHSHRVANFFTDNYDHPIVECGTVLRDMVYLVIEPDRSCAKF